jgi:hypothetical protein
MDDELEVYMLMVLLFFFYLYIYICLEDFIMALFYIQDNFYEKQV